MPIPRRAFIPIEPVTSCGRKRRAFTLIELLVVIAIIVGLLAILLPSMGRAIAVSESAVCSSRLKQFHVAMLAYAADHAGEFPGTHTWIDQSMVPQLDAWKSPPDLTTRIGEIYPYINEKDELYLCPTFLSVYTINPANAGVTPTFNYTMNIYFYRAGWAGMPSIRKLTQVRYPASLFMLAEENPWVIPGKYVSALNNTGLAPSWAPNDIVPLDALGTYHLGEDVYSGNGNAMFVDGHVASHPIEDTYEIGTPREYR